VLTDGDVREQQKVIDELVYATGLPLSIVVIAMGNKDMGFLGDLQGTLASSQRIRAAAREKAKRAQEADGARPVTPLPLAELHKLTERRDFLRVVDYARDFKGRPGAGLVSAAVGDIPGQVATYYQMHGVMPRGLDRYEDEAGNPIPQTSKLAVQATAKAASAKRGEKRSTTEDSDAETVDEEKDAATKHKEYLKSLPPFLASEYGRLHNLATQCSYGSKLIKKSVSRRLALCRFRPLRRQRYERVSRWQAFVQGCRSCRSRDKRRRRRHGR